MKQKVLFFQYYRFSACVDANYEHMKQKELFFQYYRFSACVDANYDIKESIKDIQQTVQ